MDLGKISLNYLSEKLTRIIASSGAKRVLFAFVGSNSIYYDSWAQTVYKYLKREVFYNNRFDKNLFSLSCVFKPVYSLEVDNISQEIDASRVKHNCDFVVVLDASISKVGAKGQIVVKNKGLPVKCGFLLQNSEQNVKKCSFYKEKIKTSMIGDASISCVVGDFQNNFINAFAINSSAKRACGIILKALNNFIIFNKSE